MNIIATECTGGLGDLLSRYFAVRAIGLDNKYDTHFLNFEYFLRRCENEPFNINVSGWDKIFREKSLFKENYDLSNFITKTFPLEYEKYFLEHDKILLEGYPFSFDYFIHRFEDILPEINIPNNCDFKFDKNDLVLNTRRKEWPKASNEFIDLCFTNYYTEVVMNCQPSKIILVSDDINWTIEWYQKTIFSQLKIPCTFYQDISINQFEFMIKAPNLAICQSSFSRWVGILNKNNVYSPKQWYRNVDKKVSTMNLDRWNKIEFDFC